MDALLIGEWLRGCESVASRDDAAAADLRARIRALAEELSMPKVATEQLALVASELVTNQLAHARGGETAVRAIERDGVAGIEVIAADRGEGIADVPRALHGAPVSERGADGRSLGVGLAGAIRNADEVDFDVRIGEGTCIWVRKFASSVVPRPEVGLFGRPHPGEAKMGDAATFVRREGTLLAALIDGLGHGPAAREPALIAARTVREHAGDSLSAIFEAADAALLETRGAVMTLLRIHERNAELEHAAVGNVTTRICRPRWSRSFAGRGQVLGQAAARRPTASEHFDLKPHDVVMAFTDGITSGANLQNELALMRDHPLAMAHHLVEHHFRGRDDGLALVIR